jgi:hypothetical protein
VAAAGGSCQVGTIQNVGVISTGSNCDWVRRTQSCSATSCNAVMLTLAPGWVAHSCASSSVAASLAAASDSNSTFSVERCQPALGAGMPGSPNSAFSASVSASESSTETDSASSSSINASETDSTRDSGACSTSSYISGCAGPASFPGSGCWCRPR